ncbi:AcrB/AcrD/AcrF family protein [Photobacterium gaetbulicola]|uniref:Putative efflux protein n=1 Tax=Photobacterium gaetbulicola Gung47 TaxID=658445 RepID=A0A0C5WGW2_9GAMM|nr:efflux RND transporter permease subunit [Photobacterium gaetbulicola]AJR05432.1 putative efflux protein [Photobacterium gaetbulicola Gung47]PSU12753.1 AcrB/AcrD/AcrF family protein [Photobacterium gaetbulicola]
MNLAEFAIRQRTFIVFFSVLCVIAGITSYFKLGKLEDPTFTVKSAVVVTLYPGASAQEVEAQVTDKIETRLQEMESLWKLRSLSRPGSSMVFVDLQESTSSKELPQQWDLLRRKINDVKLELPATAQISIVQDEFSEVYGMLFAITGEGIEPSELRLYAKELQRRLKAVEGIKKIELHGVRNQVVNIDLPDERLADYGLSSAQVINQLASQNMIYDAGQFKAGIERIRVDQGSEFTSLDDIRNLMIKGGVGDLGTGLIRLGDIATVSMGYQTPALSESRFNGIDAITLAVSPNSGINVVSLGDQLNQVIAEYQQTLPLGIDINAVAFQPEEVQKSINNFVSNLIESVLIVVVILWLFMGLKSALIVGSSLMLTILLTLVYMKIEAIDLQRVSLGTFILALGMLVDNAIVVTDMIISKINKGIDRLKAAKETIQETAVPLLAATIIAVMGASPVMFSTTDAAEFAGSVFWVMCASLLLSWLIAMTITPLMCWAWFKPKQTPASQGKEPQANKPSLYRKAVHYTVRHPLKGLSVLVPLLGITAFVVPHISVNFIPTSDRAMVFLDYWLPNGAQIEQTSADMVRIEDWLREQPEVKDFTTFVGASAPRFSVTVEPEPYDPSYGQILINTHDYSGIEALERRGDQWLEEQFPHAEPRFRALKLATKDKFSIEARFIGPDPEVLHALSKQAQDIMRAHPNTKYVRDDWRQKSKVIVPQLNQEQARRAGINRTDIALAIQRATNGVTLARLHQGDELIPINIRSADADINSLETLPVRSLMGLHSVPLGQVVDKFELKDEESMIWRRNRVPAITVQAAVDGMTASDVRKQLAADIEAIELPDGYRFEWGGEYYDEDRAITDTFNQLPKALLIMVIILVALFNGFKQPVIILTTVPLAATGASWFLLIADKPFGFMALIGAIALSGMIIKNGIVLMDQIELERKNGKGLEDAIEEATLNRTMAISMGALTTALGMIPLLSDRLFDQMAATIIGGLAAATVLSLFVMPALYRLFYRADLKHTTDNAGHDEELTHEKA